MLPDIKYSIPFNGNLSLAEEFLRTGKIYEVYCMGSSEHDFSYQCHQPKCAKGTIEALFKLTKKYNTRINFLVNSPLLSYRNFKQEIDYIDALQKIFGSFTITLSDPYQISEFRKRFPRLEIEASIIMNLDSFSKIERILKLGVATVNIPLFLNREFTRLREIATLKKYYPRFKMKLIVNHLCYFDCPFSSHHYFFTEIERVFGLRTGKGINLDKCVSFSLNKKELIKRPFIRPEDITYYIKSKIGDVFKILWRHSNSTILKNTVLAYLKNSYSGNLFDIVETHEKTPSLYCDNRKFPPNFIKRVTNCDKTKCRECNYCGEVGKKVIRKI